ncbi:MAG: glycosyltransferase family 39 protein [Candidatus Hydrogenedentota bacterium]
MRFSFTFRYKLFIIPRIYIVIFLLAFTVRFLYLLELKHKSPFFDKLIYDSRTYDNLAVEIIKSGSHPEKVFWQSPFYTYFLYFIYKIFGHNYFVVRLIQIIIGSFSCLIIYLLGREVFSHSTGLIASLIMCFYGPLIFYDNELLTPTLTIFFLSSFFLCIAKIWHKTNSVLTWFLSGLLFGLSVLCMANLFIYLPLFMVLVFFIFKKRIALYILVFRLSLFLIAVLLIICPVTLRNYFVGGDLVFISYNYGINLYIGNNSNWVDTVMIREGYWWNRLASMPSLEKGWNLKPSEKANYFVNKVRNFILDSPMEFLKILFLKIFIFFNFYEIPRNIHIYELHQFSILLKILVNGYKWFYYPYGLLLPFSIFGIFISTKYYRPFYSLFYFFIPCFIFSIVIFFVTARYRLPLIPILTLFASFGIIYLIRHPSKCYLFLIVLIPLVLVNILLPSKYSFKLKELNTNLASIHFNSGEFQKAIDYINLSLDDLKDSPFATKETLTELYFHLGASYYNIGNFKWAHACLIKVLSLAPNHLSARRGLFMVNIRTAENYVDICDHIDISSITDPYILNALSRLHVDKNYRLDKGIKAIQKAIDIKSDEPSFYDTLADLYSLQGNHDSAALVLQRKDKLFK